MKTVKEIAIVDDTTTPKKAKARLTRTKDLLCSEDCEWGKKAKCAFDESNTLALKIYARKSRY
jgi:hypothetical protein